MSLSKAVYSLWTASCRALMPPPKPATEAEHTLYRSLIKHADACVYCGDAANSQDHFRAFMKARGKPSGYGDDIWNLVPSCTTCNSSKGNKHWRVFMLRTSGKTPLARGVRESVHRDRMARLTRFEQVGNKYVQRWAASKFATRLAALRTSMLLVTQKHATGVGSLKLQLAASSGKTATTTKVLKTRKIRSRTKVTREEYVRIPLVGEDVVAGARVMAHWNVIDGWYPATVMHVSATRRNAKFRIMYDDDDVVESNVGNGRLGQMARMA